MIILYTFAPIKTNIKLITRKKLPPIEKDSTSYKKQ